MEGTHIEVLNSKFRLTIRYIRLLQHGYKLFDYLKNQGIDAVVIYGITDLALTIIEEYKINNSLNEIKAISDKKISNGNNCTYCDIPCVAPHELLNIVDKNVLVIITPMGWHREIRNNIKKMGFDNVITVQDLIFDMCSAADKTGW